jgi:L,D-peptidoglycan transpeptidase YkuD (ErfK/YbiS/YcfS/YnhG family)
MTESGDRGSERPIDYPTQYAKALVISFNRCPATPGRGAGIVPHVNGSGAMAGCVRLGHPGVGGPLGLSWDFPPHQPARA